MRKRRIAVALAICLTFSTLLVGIAEARTDNRSKPIIYVHGLDAFGTAGTDCNMWNTMQSRLASWGQTGTAVKLKYYTGDTNCSHSLDHHGSHTKHYSSDAHDGAGTSHTADASIRHLGYHFAWYVYDHFSSVGVPVDLVGHSMGGLIIRYALAQTQLHHPDFPPYLYVEDVVTLGTPHQGSNWSGWCFLALECNEIFPSSSFMSWLATNAQNPQGQGGTDWTTIASYDDTYVSEGSGTGMDATHKIRYLGSMNIEHSDYYNDTSDTRDADVEYWDRPGPWYSWYDGPHAVRWSDFALTYGTW